MIYEAARLQVKLKPTIVPYLSARTQVLEDRLQLQLCCDYVHFGNPFVIPSAAINLVATNGTRTESQHIISL